MFSNAEGRKSVDSLSPVSPSANRTDFPFHRYGDKSCRKLICLTFLEAKFDQYPQVKKTRFDRKLDSFSRRVIGHSLRQLGACCAGNRAKRCARILPVYAKLLAHRSI